MFRRLVRARRRVPFQSAGHESSERSEANSPQSIDVYHACVSGDDPVPLFIEDWTREQLKKSRRFPPDVFRDRARSWVSHVSQEERDATQAWSRLRQLYSVFQAIQAAQDAKDSDDEDELTSTVANGDATDTVLHDFHQLTADLPEGFTSHMFVELGNALYTEMMATSPPSPSNGISRESFENVGNQLYFDEAASTIVSLTVSA